ncbi:MAG: AAA family ATPase, partial [Chloroflexi bacterium]|nr:AAA family ATPase [Chloroflexota bacterium]
MAGQLLLVTGEPGIGKSAVLTEVARRGSHRGARVLRGVCWRGDGAPPYWPWTQVLRDIELDAVGFGEAGRLLVSQPIGGVGSAQQAADARFRLFDSVAGLFTRLARDRPLLISLDDLQWADAASVQLLEFVARQCAAKRVLLLGAARDDETAGALVSLGGQLLPLTGLSSAEVGTLVTVIAGSHPSEEQANAVWRRSGGNPLFVRELTRLVLARGDSGGPLPDSVRQTLTERLARVSHACAKMLEVAAVDGLHLQLDVLTRALDLTSDSAANLLDEAVRARVVVVDDTGAHFAHDLFRETILTQLSSAHTAALHASIGRALQTLSGGARHHDRAEVGATARLAAHFVAAGPTLAAEALDYSVLAAQEATARLGHADAVQHYEAALGLVADDPKRRVDLLFALAGACDRAGDSVAARSAYRRVADAARSSADWITLARAGLGLHSLGSRAAADERECAGLLTEANARLRAEASPAGSPPDRA